MSEPQTISDQIRRFRAKEWAMVGGGAGIALIFGCCLLSCAGWKFSGGELQEESQPTPNPPTAAAVAPPPPKKELIDPKEVFDGRSLLEWQQHPAWKEVQSILAMTSVLEVGQEGVTPIARMRALGYRLAINGFNSEVKGLTVTQSIDASLTGARWLRESDDFRLVAKVDQSGSGVLIVVAAGKDSDPLQEPGLACVSLLKGVLPEASFIAADDAYRAAMKRTDAPVKVDWKAGGYEGFAHWGKSPEEKGKVLGGIVWAVAD